MSHESYHGRKLAESLVSRGKIPASFQEIPARARRLKTANAIMQFQSTHDLKFGSPSGTVTWEITCSNHWRDWSYQAEKTIRQVQGPPTPLQILGRDKCAEDRNIVTLTDLHVKACIGPHHAENYPVAIWETALIRSELQAIALGAVAIKPDEPAEAAWFIPIIHSSDSNSYGGTLLECYCLALGNHAVITNSKDDVNSLINHLKNTAQKRFRGHQTPPVSGWTCEIYET